MATARMMITLLALGAVEGALRGRESAEDKSVEGKGVEGLLEHEAETPRGAAVRRLQVSEKDLAHFTSGGCLSSLRWLMSAPGDEFRGLRSRRAGRDLGV